MIISSLVCFLLATVILENLTMFSKNICLVLVLYYKLLSCPFSHDLCILQLNVILLLSVYALIARHVYLHIARACDAHELSEDTPTSGCAIAIACSACSGERLEIANCSLKLCVVRAHDALHLDCQCVPGELRLYARSDGVVYLGKAKPGSHSQLLQKPRQPHRDRHGDYGEVDSGYAFYIHTAASNVVEAEEIASYGKYNCADFRS